MMVLEALVSLRDFHAADDAVLPALLEALALASASF